MLRHIIVEGPDGAGKTTLIGVLLSELPHMKLAKRAVQSDGARVPHLDKWAIDSVGGMHTMAPSIFDRHALISEPIYGPIVRRALPGMFAQPWWVKSMTSRLALNALIIVCLPEMSVVRENVKQAEGIQMEGVADNIDHIWMAYRNMTWPGVAMHYNYKSAAALSIAHIARKVVTRNG